MQSEDSAATRGLVALGAVLVIAVPACVLGVALTADAPGLAALLGVAFAATGASVARDVRAARISLPTGVAGAATLGLLAVLAIRLF